MTPTTKENSHEVTQEPLPSLLEKVPQVRRQRPSAPRRFVTHLYVRATEDEKRRIEEKAKRAGISISRYLARAGAEDRLPPSREERTRLEDLMYRFKRASLFLDHIAANAVEGRDRSGISSSQGQELRDASRLLASLATELKKRL